MKLSRMRLTGLVRKEFLQILRDPSSLAIAFVLPLFLLLLFGYGVSLNAHNVPVAVVLEHPDPGARQFAAALEGSPWFETSHFAVMAPAERAMREHRVDAIVRLRGNFGGDIETAAGSEIQLIVNGVDANTAQMIRGYVEASWQVWLSRRADVRGHDFVMPVKLQPRTWFNANARSRDYLVPGLIAVIMTLIGALLTALVIAREWERGTMETMIVTPVSMTEILLGKLTSYFILGMGGLSLSVAMAIWLFGVPLRGSVWVLFSLSALFLLVALGMGLVISIISRNQFVAGMIAINATFLPAFLLSGFVFDIHSMPVVIRAITWLIPARYYVEALQTIFLAGDIGAILGIDALALALMATALLTISIVRSHKRLE